MEFLNSEHYPELCDKCKTLLDNIAMVYKEGEMPDTDDEEAPCNYLYDNSMFCGGRSCANQKRGFTVSTEGRVVQTFDRDGNLIEHYFIAYPSQWAEYGDGTLKDNFPKIKIELKEINNG